MYEPMATTQRALRRMKVTNLRNQSPFTNAASCTAYALAALLSNGQPSASVIEHCTISMYKYKSTVKENGVYGVPSNVIRKVYRTEYGLKHTAALIDGERFPKTCILHLYSRKHGGGHVVARVDGVLIDTFDCTTDEDAYEIAGFFTAPKGSGRWVSVAYF